MPLLREFADLFSFVNTVEEGQVAGKWRTDSTVTSVPKRDYDPKTGSDKIAADQKLPRGIWYNPPTKSYVVTFVLPADVAKERNKKTENQSFKIENGDPEAALGAAMKWQFMTYTKYYGADHAQRMRKQFMTTHTTDQNEIAEPETVRAHRSHDMKYISRKEGAKTWLVQYRLYGHKIYGKFKDTDYKDNSDDSLAAAQRFRDDELEKIGKGKGTYSRMVGVSYVPANKVWRASVTAGGKQQLIPFSTDQWTYQGAWEAACKKVASYTNRPVPEGDAPPLEDVLKAIADKKAESKLSNAAKSTDEPNEDI
jgi:stalled ribosome alternative rescue factor ArfA